MLNEVNFRLKVHGNVRAVSSLEVQPMMSMVALVSDGQDTICGLEVFPGTHAFGLSAWFLVDESGNDVEIASLKAGSLSELAVKATLLGCVEEKGSCDAWKNFFSE